MLQNYIILCALLVGSSFGADVAINWGGSCSSGGSFSFSWAATSGGEPFKPDAKNAPQVPCDEYFEVSFYFVDNAGNIVNFPQILSALFNQVSKSNVNGIVAVTLQAETPTFGGGGVSTTGAVYASNNQPFTFTCTNSVPNVKIRTNYLLTATNDGGTPNYARTLDAVTDGGFFGTGLTTPSPSNPLAAFGAGQTMCNNGVFVTFTFPAVTTAVAQTSVTPTPTTAAQPTSAAGQPTSAAGQPTSAAAQPTSAAGQPTFPIVTFVPIIHGGDATSLFITFSLVIACLLLVI